MKILIDDKFSEAHLEHLKKLGCDVTCNPSVNAEELPGIIGPCKALVVRGEVVNQAALKTAWEAKKNRAGLDVFDPEPAEAAAFADQILDLANLCGAHHIGASTERAQEAIAMEAVRTIKKFVKTGVVLNCVNFARSASAKWLPVVRHHDRLGVLADVMGKIRRANVNVEEVQNIIFDGAVATGCRAVVSDQREQS